MGVAKGDGRGKGRWAWQRAMTVAKGDGRGKRSVPGAVEYREGDVHRLYYVGQW